MKRPIEETLEEARQFFLDRAKTAREPKEREVSEHLCELAEAVQENCRMLDVLRGRLDDLRHVMGVR